MMRVIILALVFVFVSCGLGNKNAFQNFEKKDTAADATHELENNHPEKAILLLEAALVDNPKDYQLISLLSAAYAQKNGIDLITMALKMAESASDSKTALTASSSSSSNGISVLWPALPEATGECIAGINYAVELLQTIPATDRTNADSFKLALLSTVLVSLQLKALDLDGDGALSLQELLRLNATSAATIFSGLLGAVDAVTGMEGSLGDNSNGATDQISKTVTELQDSPGDTEEEQIRNYFQPSSSN